MMDSCTADLMAAPVVPVSFVDLVDGSPIPHIGGVQGGSHVQFQARLSAAPSSGCVAFDAVLTAVDGTVFDHVQGAVRVGDDATTSMVYMLAAGRLLPQAGTLQPDATLAFTAGGETLTLRLGEGWAGDASVAVPDPPDAGAPDAAR